MHRIFLAAGALLLPTASFATDYDVRFCPEVNIALTDDATGDRWDDDTVNKPARGFYAWVTEVSPSPGTVWLGWMEDDGTWVGCTPELVLSSSAAYDVTVYSMASVNSNVFNARDNPTNDDVAVALVEDDYSPTADDVEISVLPGNTDDRWNLLAVVAYVMALHDGGLTGELWDIYDDGGPSAGTGGVIRLGDERRKYVIAHEVGHLVSFGVDVGGPGCQNDNTAARERCSGGGQIHKEFTSAAACEGIANFYSAISWNLGGHAADCDFAGAAHDFDLDGVNNISALDPFACHGDPGSFSPDPDDKDWLEDLVTLDDDDIDNLDCDGTLTNRSTEYDITRFFWAMLTVEDVPITDLWEVWDLADPHDWIVDDSIPINDRPAKRLEAAAALAGPGYATEFAAQSDHGLFH